MSVESKVVDLRGHKVVLVMSSEFDLDYVFITPNYTDSSCDITGRTL